MLIGVCSDSHDHLDNVRKAVELFNARGVAHVLHGGDFVAPFVINELRRLNAPFNGIFGNNDGERLGLKKWLTEIGDVQVQPLYIELVGRKLAMVHEPDTVEPLAASGLYDVVIYGHTHKVDVRQEGCLILNPGELCGWQTGQPTVALLNLATLEAEIVRL